MCLEGISGSPPGPDMGGAPGVVRRPLSTSCLRHAVAPRRPRKPEAKGKAVNYGAMTDQGTPTAFCTAKTRLTTTYTTVGYAPFRTTMNT